MSKAILVLEEMPDDCTCCIFQKNNLQCTITRQTTIDFYEKRPDWCPLQTLPEKQQEYLEGDEWSEGIMCGWNDCIDAIEGNGEDA